MYMDREDCYNDNELPLHQGPDNLNELGEGATHHKPVTQKPWEYVNFT